MIVIQEAAANIKMTSMQNSNEEVATALKDFTNKVNQLEAANNKTTKPSSSLPKPSLLIRVSWL